MPHSVWSPNSIPYEWRCAVCDLLANLNAVTCALQLSDYSVNYQMRITNFVMLDMIGNDTSLLYMHIFLFRLFNSLKCEENRSYNFCLNRVSMAAIFHNFSVFFARTI
ncbi:hypothetical protein Y032_0015g2524 [Ancylostoma ceylanicum]|uniref:Uncharacterized protein n=1 Tax=Ancylostoma ceylanicum TaxID=53326 RepID=A0A016V7F7_9BILA|nr:hypothetical protein Y032_0015g2524 [Ancylostoma ceylanicum]